MPDLLDSGAALDAFDVQDIPTALAIERLFDNAKLATEKHLLSILQREWARFGNIQVQTFTLEHTVQEGVALPAIVVGFTPPVDFRGMVGALIPILRFTVAGIVPWVGTKQSREHLLVMGERIVQILRNNTRAPFWNELRIERMQVIGDDESPPRWEAVTVSLTVFHKPLKLAGVPHEIIPDLVTEGIDDPVLAAERYLAHMLQTEWARHGNIKVRTVTVARTVVEGLAIPAIVVGLTPPLRHQAIVGGYIPLARFVVAGITPWVGTKEARVELQKMACRLVGILLSHFKTPHWHDLRIINVQVIGGAEATPRWEAATVTIEVSLNPITLVTRPTLLDDESAATDLLTVS